MSRLVSLLTDLVERRQTAHRPGSISSPPELSPPCEGSILFYLFFYHSTSSPAFVPSSTGFFCLGWAEDFWSEWPPPSDSEWFHQVLKRRPQADCQKAVGGIISAVIYFSQRFWLKGRKRLIRCTSHCTSQLYFSHWSKLCKISGGRFNLPFILDCWRPYLNNTSVSRLW